MYHHMIEDTRRRGKMQRWTNPMKEYLKASGLSDEDTRVLFFIVFIVGLCLKVGSLNGDVGFL